MSQFMDIKAKIALFLIVALWALISFWLWWPYVPIEIHSIHIVNPDGIVYSGDTLDYEVTYTKTKAYPVTNVLRQLVNGHVITLVAISGSNLPLGKNKKIIVKVILPHNADSGTYILCLSAIYQVNPIRTIIVSANSEQFQIKSERG